MMDFLNWTTTTKERSLDEQVWDLKTKISNLVNNVSPLGIPSPMAYASNPGGEWWVSEVYPDYAIICKGPKNYRQNYHLDESGSPVLDGEKYEVTQIKQWVPVAPPQPEV